MKMKYKTLAVKNKKKGFSVWMILFQSKKMLRSLDTSHFALLRSFLLSPSSFSCHSSFGLKTITSLSQSISKSHSFLSLCPTQENASPHFRSSVIRCVSSFPTLHWNHAVSCTQVDAPAHDQDTTKPAIPVRAFFFSTRYIHIKFFDCVIFNLKLSTIRIRNGLNVFICTEF